MTDRSNSPLLAAYRGRPVTRRPVWFMRQAGRSLPEYRALREGISMLDACLTPELAAEITVQPVRRHDVDAGIFFSDIVIPLRLAGIGVEIVPGVGRCWIHRLVVRRTWPPFPNSIRTHWHPSAKEWRSRWPSSAPPR